MYIHGSVGSGKSAVMDMFYAHAKEQRVVPLMRRVHFNAAMLEVGHVALLFGRCDVACQTCLAG